MAVRNVLEKNSVVLSCVEYPQTDFSDRMAIEILYGFHNESNSVSPSLAGNQQSSSPDRGWPIAPEGFATARRRRLNSICFLLFHSISQAGKNVSNPSTPPRAVDPDTGKKSEMQEIPVDRDQESDLTVP
jgi:hypothetical protein